MEESLAVGERQAWMKQVFQTGSEKSMRIEETEPVCFLEKEEKPAGKKKSKVSV